MSRTSSPVRRTATVVVAFATATGLAWGGVTAQADPPHLNVDPCAELLAEAALWPGEMSDGTRLHSDAFDSYLSRQPACQSGT
ncbi:MAG TPA: hypothetical protein VK402_16995 [Blastococcus sp.]|nr:hypothetical protein [Blastococcus sp.]